MRTSAALVAVAERVRLTRAILALALRATLRVVQNRSCDFVELTKPVKVTKSPATADHLEGEFPRGPTA
jgi:hypothetical protein